MSRRSPIAAFWKLLSSSHTIPAGWTVIELATVSVTVGILASIVTPSLQGIRARMTLRRNLSELKQSLQQAQRNAIKLGKECKVQMDTESKPPVLRVAPEAKYKGCLPFQELALKDVKLYENFPGTTIRFSYKGNSRNLGTMVIESLYASNKRYCIVMSNGIGMMRSGIYEETPPIVSAAYCKTAI